MKTLILYDSLGGNTEKAAQAIREAVEAQLLPCEMVKVARDTELDFYDYDLVFIGSPVIDWLPTQCMMDFVKTALKGYNARGLIRPSSPLVPGKFGVCFGTFAGPHIGEHEAEPMTMWLRSFLEHIGFLVLDRWHIVGGFRDKEELNLHGRLGDIRNRPDSHDLSDVRSRTAGIVSSLAAWRDYERK
ncbi:MAG: flavodoxin family protein [Geobacter sp.]|nr:MAG: flavodoxin family protein [Geobacter sp.]